VKKTLRYYQSDAVDAILASWRTREQVPYVSVMMGLGKSLIIADLIERCLIKDKRVLCLVPRKELVEQNYKEALEYVTNPSALGICCGQLGRHQTNRQAVIAMASSFVGRRARGGAFDILLIDECHRVRLEFDSTYRKIVDALLRLNPKMVIAGLTGTPYRLDQGELHDKSPKGVPLWTHKVYDTTIEPGIPRLIAEGYLPEIKALNSGVSVDLSGVRTTGGDYNKDDMGVKFDAICPDAVEDMRAHFDAHNIKTALVFCSNLTNARHVLLEWFDEKTMRIVYGDMPKDERKLAIEWIKNGTGRRIIVNVDILAEGFNFPALQCVVLMRATKSPGLLAQMAWRHRVHADKGHGYLIDYGTNIERLGSLDNIQAPKNKKREGDAPKKPCLACCTLNILSAKKCVECEAEFISTDESGHYTMRTKAQAMAAKIEHYEIDQVLFERAWSVKSALPMIKALMYCDYELIHTHYFCFDHAGFARVQSVKLLTDMLKNKNDLGELLRMDGGICVDNMLPLLIDNAAYDQYLKRFNKVSLMPDGKYKKMIGWGFHG
jgi:DNA repair protein RadD